MVHFSDLFIHQKKKTVCLVEKEARTMIMSMMWMGMSVVRIFVLIVSVVVGFPFVFLRANR